MFTITKKPRTPNILWDAAKGEPLCRFVKGVLKTNDVNLAGRLKDMGYEVTGGSDKASDGEPIPVIPPKDVGQQTPSDTPDDDPVGDGSENDPDDPTNGPDKEDAKPKRRNRKAVDK